MTLPIVPAILPADLSGQQNGKLDPALLQPIHARGNLHHTVARGWRALVSAAEAQGLPLTFTYGGCYRTYNEQYTLFMQRYTTSPIPGRPTKAFQGKTWYLKPGMATAATPGTSNHGWACAIDTAFDNDPSDGLGPDDAAAIANHPKFAWFRDNVIHYGFSFELQSEPWHIRWVVGDKIPAAVLAFEGGSQPDPVPPVPSVPGYHVIAVADKFEFATATRWDTRGFGAPLKPDQYAVKLEGSDGKIGATVSLTITNQTTGGYGTVWKGDTPAPDKSSINWHAPTSDELDQTVANQISVPLAADGTFKVYISGPAHIIVDLVGYWS